MITTARDPRLPRIGWPPGLWDEEPDRAYWHDATTGLPCLASRSPTSGAWCGYVAVKQDHPWYGLDHQADALNDLDVHGGLTYSDCQGVGPTQPYADHIELWNSWWFGFDCAHCYDVLPMWLAHYNVIAQHYLAQITSRGWNQYRTLEYVQGQCTLLAAQFVAATSCPRPCQ